jgi:LPS-assembly protein
MRHTLRWVWPAIVAVAAVAALPAPAHAQATLGECQNKAAQSFSSDGPQRSRPAAADDPAGTTLVWSATENVVVICDSSQLFADEVEYFEGADTVRARGHVTFIDGAQRITAERLEFNTKTKLGTFWNAQGIMNITSKPSPQSLFGSTEADAYFSGEVIEKIGPDKYRFTNGTMTTCVQPTPRWEFSGTKVTVVKDKRAILRNAVLRVKDVPVLYLPWFYYPINKEGRSTGFLMPQYGHSTIRGQTFSEAFFWAINRSMDATVTYDFSSTTGSGYGSEFRYIQAPGSEGNARLSVFNGKDAANSAITSRTVDMVASMTQRLPGNWQMRGNVNFANNLTARQLLQQDVSVATNITRYAGVNVQGQAGRIRLSGEAYVNDIFTDINSSTSATRTGRAPTIRAEYPAAPIGSSRVYFGVASELASIVRQDAIGDPATNRGLMRFDATPTLRTPIGSLPYLNVTATVGLRFTYWNEQLDAQGAQIEDPLNRQLLDMTVDVVGPTLNRIFDTAGSGYASRWKHVIQPTLSVNRKTSFDGFNRVVRNDSVDTIVGGMTTYTYGLRNSLFAKRRHGAVPGQAQEVASVTLQQTYYSDATGGLYDTSYQGRGAVGSFSPLSIQTNVQPTQQLSMQGTVQYDTKFHAIRTTTVGGGLNAGRVTSNVSWSKYYLIKGLSGYDNPENLSHTLNTGASLRSPSGKLATNWSWSYDFTHDRQVQQRLVLSYMSQCCGIAAEYQSFYVGTFANIGVKTDRRFNFSFSLAGIGTFANLLGSFGR